MNYELVIWTLVKPADIVTGCIFHFTEESLAAGWSPGTVQSRPALPVREAALGDGGAGEGNDQELPDPFPGSHETADPLSDGVRPSADTTGQCSVI